VFTVSPPGLPPTSPLRDEQFAPVGARRAVVYSRIREPPMPRPLTGDRRWMA
jgi:hypothetical protein